MKPLVLTKTARRVLVEEARVPGQPLSLSKSQSGEISAPTQFFGVGFLWNRNIPEFSSDCSSAFLGLPTISN